jgi:hypothetical protein
MKAMISIGLVAMAAGCASNPAGLVDGPTAGAAPVSIPADGQVSNGDVSVGPVQVAGGDVEDASEVANSLTQDLRRCPGQGQPSTRSELTVSAKIGPQGEVRFAKPEGGFELRREVVRCITGHVASAQFAPPRGQDPTVIIPIALSYR